MLSFNDCATNSCMSFSDLLGTRDTILVQQKGRGQCESLGFSSSGFITVLCLIYSKAFTGFGKRLKLSHGVLFS